MDEEFFRDPELLVPPIRRAAYSDRTALIMAQLSALAYEPFELEGGEGHNKLISDLERGGFKLVKKYNENGTQAFLVKQIANHNRSNGIVVLSFRGTQPDLQDWMTDLNAKIQDVGGVRVHKGFWDAFKSVEESIAKDLEVILEKGDALYITGHSLGGALALIATRQLGSDSTGACYTFGSPRVGSYGFSQQIKTPIYRIVNSNDIVPNTPPQHLQKALIYFLSSLKISWANKAAKKMDNFTGYVHHGDMRYLTKGKYEKESKYDDVMLLSNPGLFDRMSWWFAGVKTNLIGGAKEAIDHHSMSLYCSKLRAYAKGRN